MFTSSRKSFFSFSMALICLLCVFFGSYAQNVQSPNVDKLNQFTWRWVGPMTFSGRIAAVSVPRGQSLTYYALVASGGLWKTVDGGIHFEPIFERYGTLSMGWMAIAPSNQDILYLGTGEPMHARASTHGNGVWKSTDAGKTWTNVGLVKSYFIPKVEVDFKNPDIVFVAAEGKLYDNEIDCERGLYKSTDGGKTWANIFPVKDRGVADFVIDPRNSNVIIAAASDVPARLDLHATAGRATICIKPRTAARPGKSPPTACQTNPWDAPALPFLKRIPTSSMPGSIRA